jgi:hypothetical protein
VLFILKEVNLMAKKKRTKRVAAKQVKCEPSSCTAWLGWTFLVFGLLYLLKDYNTLAGVTKYLPEWYVLLFLIAGLATLMKR